VHDPQLPKKVFWGGISPHDGFGQPKTGVASKNITFLSAVAVLLGNLQVFFVFLIPMAAETQLWSKIVQDGLLFNAVIVTLANGH